MFTTKAGLFGSAFFALALNCHAITASIEYRASSIEHSASSIQNRESSIEHFQSKTLIPLNKNQNFQNFFNSFPNTCRSKGFVGGGMPPEQMGCREYWLCDSRRNDRPQNLRHQSRGMRGTLNSSGRFLPGHGNTRTCCLGMYVCTQLWRGLRTAWLERNIYGQGRMDNCRCHGQ